MNINSFEIKDYLADMRSKVTMSFEDSPVFDKYLQLFASQVEEIQQVYKQLMQDRSIDTAVGKQLDIIGDIVGQPRELISTEFIPYFGYQGAFEVQSYGDLDDSSVGGYYWDYNQPLAGNVLLNDEQYRLFIKAKILKNITRATPEDVINFITFVFGVEKVQITVDQGAEQALILVSDDLNLFEIALLRYFVDKEYRSYFVPKSLGVGYVFGTIPTTNFFSYLGVSDGEGFGTYVEETEEVIGGGKYASLFGN